MAIKKIDTNKLLIWLLLILILFGIFARLISLNRDFNAEESDFIKPALSLIKTGRPVVYLSEQQPKEIALWHPPMYIFLLSLVIRISPSEIATRSVNVFFSLVTTIIIYMFCSRLLEHEQRKIIGLMASTLFLTNYYALSSSMMIDLDPSSTLFVLSFVFFVLLYRKNGASCFLVASGLALFLSVFNRYPMAIMAYLGLGVYFYHKKRKNKNLASGDSVYLRSYIYLGIFSFSAFFIIWSFYSLVIEPGTFLSFTYHNIRLGSESILNPKVYVASFILNIAQLIRLLTFPFVVLTLASSIYFLRNKNEETNVLLVYSLIISIFFILVPRPAFGYPRYFMTSTPGFCILISYFLFLKLEKEKINLWLLLELIFSFVLSSLALSFLKPQSTIYESNGLIKSTNLPDFLFNIFASFPLFLLLFVKKKKKDACAILILIALLFSYSIYFDLAYIIHHSYNKEAGEYIKKMTKADDVILSPKAIGYYAQRRFYNNDNNKPPLSSISFSFLMKYFTKSLENREMDDPFFWPKSFNNSFYPPQPSEKELSKAKYAVTYYSVEGKEPEKIIGEFYIYKLR